MPKEANNSFCAFLTDFAAMQTRLGPRHQAPTSDNKLARANRSAVLRQLCCPF
jgi:hypothetical protein